MISYDKIAALLPQCTRIVFSRPYAKDTPKLTIQAMTGTKFPFQACRTTADKVFHTSVWDVVAYVQEQLPLYRELHLFGEEEYSALLSKGTVVSIKHLGKSNVAPATHNRVKQYLINEGDSLPIFVKLGIFTQDYKVVHAKQDKFRQINRYLEMLDDVLRDFDGDHIEVVDYGCGKSYLSFAVYYYLTAKRHLSVHLVGVDRKVDVIRTCSLLAEQYGYTGMQFVAADIADYTLAVRPDLVISLHACDVATDLVLAAAIRAQAQYIFAAPCCQHELNGQIDRDWLPIMLHHGIVRERFAALLTDSIRCTMLELYHYKVDIMEFVDITDSPKNLLIRATRARHTPEYLDKQRRQLKEILALSGTQPTLCRLLPWAHE